MTGDVGVGPRPRPLTETCPERMRRAVMDARGRGRRVGFVPTMGALHAGHASLVTRAVAECDDVVASIFVNPTQFAPHEDFARYPRTPAADHDLLAAAGARWIFTPDTDAIYPRGAATQVTVCGPALPFEGAVRPGHFTGVATVVCRLLHAVPADTVYFGAKDWQQTLVVRRMVRDLGLPVDVAVCPTVRDPDGLALSSRNAYLSAADRSRAVALHESLVRAGEMWHGGEAVTAIEKMLGGAIAARGIACDYAAVVDPETLEPLTDPRGPAIVLVAGRLGRTRLIDNMPLASREFGR